ncbi:MAG: quinol monooxygenase YgiN [Flavobacteriales bacterium]|jgi:quinol monooxygenase YgiN
MSISYIIEFRAKDKHSVEFADIMTNVKSELPKVSGCLGVSIYHNEDEPNCYVLTETWQDKTSHAKHVEGLVRSGAWQGLSEQLSEDPTGAYYTSI